MAATPDTCVEEVPEDREETVTEEVRREATTPEDTATTPDAISSSEVPKDRGHSSRRRRSERRSAYYTRSYGSNSRC